MLIFITNGCRNWVTIFEIFVVHILFQCSRLTFNLIRNLRIRKQRKIQQNCMEMFAIILKHFFGTLSNLNLIEEVLKNQHTLSVFYNWNCIENLKYPKLQAHTYTAWLHFLTWEIFNWSVNFSFRFRIKIQTKEYCRSSKRATPYWATYSYWVNAAANW